MALQVWLPLNNNLENKGLSNITITPTGGSDSYTDGKIGKCLTPNSRYYNISPITLGSEASICCWTKTTINNKMSWVLESTASNKLNLYEATYYSLNTGDGGSNTFQNNGSNVAVLHDGLWHHFAVTFGNNKAQLYIDGEYAGTAPTFRNPTCTNSKIKLAGGYNNAHSYDWNGSLNDFRVYDHCLSPKEVHEIAKGLVLHYKLDANGYGCIGNVNLVKNGWGGTENWDNSNYSTTEIPSITGITHSYYGSNKTKDFIPIISNHTYEISCYIKARETNTCYVSLIPYDIDKNQIFWYNSSGFRTSSLTTLAQDLKNGDTIIYLTDASNWANPTKYQYYVAIFGYSDSTGYTYPDLVYTRRIYAFGTQEDKSNLDVANNTVTLRAAYSGQTIPKGTSICLTGAGSGYYYPITVTAANASDWILESKTFIPQDVKYLKAAKYVKVLSTSSYQYLAGITLKDITDSDVIYDCSGYEHHGEIIGDLITIDSNTPRYNYCIYMNNTGTTNHIETNQIEVSDDIFTVSFWIKASKSTNQVFVADAKIVIGTLNSLLYVVKTSSTPFTTTNFVNNEWNHIVVIRNDTTYKAYINGKAETRSGANNSYRHNGNKLYLLNRSYNTTYAANASISDFRIYATELSEDDIKELYNNPANIDNEGNIFGYEFEESNNNMLFEENYGIISKQWLRGLGKYTQTNCQCTLEDEGYKIYRPANLASGSSNKTWGGLVLRNYDNQFGLRKNHTYIIEFDVKGQSSNAASWLLSFNCSDDYGTTGLRPSPSNVIISNPVVNNFNSDTYKHCSYKFTINDEIYKTCVTNRGSFVSGETYVSYRDFKFGYEYIATGELGTDIYIKNLSMRDITTNTNININKNGIVTSQMFNEFDNTTKFYSSGMIKSTKIIEK